MGTGKSDYELSFEYYTRDGGVVRVPEQVRSQEYKGGTAEDSEMNEAQAMVAKYPRLVKDVVEHAKTSTCALKLHSLAEDTDAMLNAMEQVVLPKRLGVKKAKEAIAQVALLRPLSDPLDVKSICRAQVFREKRDLYFHLQEKRLGVRWDGPRKVRSRTVPANVDTPAGRKRLAELRAR